MSAFRYDIRSDGVSVQDPDHPNAWYFVTWSQVIAYHKLSEEVMDFEIALESIAEDTKPWHTCEHGETARAALQKSEEEEIKGA